MITLHTRNENDSITLSGQSKTFDRLALDILEKINSNDFKIEDLKNLKTLYFKIEPSFSLKYLIPPK